MNKMFDDEIETRRVNKFLDMEVDEVRAEYMVSKLKGKNGNSIIHNGVFDMDRFLDLLLDVKICLERSVEYVPGSMSTLLHCEDVNFKYISIRVSKYNMTCREALKTYFRFINKFDLYDKIYTNKFDFIDWVDINRSRIEASIKIKINKDFKLSIIFE